MSAPAPVSAAPLGTGVWADMDPTNDFVVAPPDPIADCEGQLRAAGVTFAAAELPVKEGKGKRPTCGVEQAVVYKRGPAKVRYNSAPLVSCRLALGLARFEQVLTQEAERYFGQGVARVEQGGTYNCRKMARFNLVSEHAYANAIDIRSVTLKNGRKLTVLGGFGRIDVEPKSAESRFWRSLANRLFDEGAFSVVITPFYDGLHKDHIHLDEARYRADGSRPTG
ncbi:MAG TPA: extensin family protein [Polyangiaceae bacterium]|nr:extensin family protein [Polyangiaceae bacterium]